MSEKKKQMIWGIIIIVLAIGCVALLVYSQTGNTAEDPQDLVMNSENTDVLGYIEHGTITRNRSQDGELLPYEYTNGEFELEYFMNTKGIAETVGFMVFVDGKPVQSKINPEEMYHYCNYIQVDNENEQYLFTISFTPPMGNKGDIFDLDIVSIYNPSYQPDMKETISYNINHSAVTSFYKLHYNEDTKERVPLANDGSLQLLSEMKVYDEVISEDFAAEDFGLESHDNFQGMLSENVYQAVYLDDQVRFDHLKVSQEFLHITYKMAGVPGVKYQTAFFINHEPIASDSALYFESVTEEGKITVIDAYLDVSRLSSASTFYVMSIPENSENNIDAGIGIYKSPSILLYKE